MQARRGGVARCGWIVVWGVVLSQGARAALAQGAEAVASRGEPVQIWLVRQVIGLVILGLSVYLVALVVWMFRRYRRSEAVPDALVRRLEDWLERRRYAQAYELVIADRSHLGRVLGAGVRQLGGGRAAVQRAMELANEQVTLEMEHRASYLATVATLGPMLGLLGTVYGMIMSFGVIARSAATPQTGELAGGIATALIATLEGIAVAVPAIAFHAVFRNRISKLALEVQVVAEGLVERFGPGARSLHPLAVSALSAAGQSWAALPDRERPEE
ncbi:MAG: hypothetical protein KatS3mg108_2511 [Isosphaeraceae bacterium]|jgi:biopolymer transport protein ExbB|nr:MAG: hypothetical protein KatS3mg108_2511 [Isosphaeraceae bacterium]